MKASALIVAFVVAAAFLRAGEPAALAKDTAKGEIGAYKGVSKPQNRGS